MQPANSTVVESAACPASLHKSELTLVRIDIARHFKRETTYISDTSTSFLVLDISSLSSAAKVTDEINMIVMVQRLKIPDNSGLIFLITRPSNAALSAAAAAL